MDPKELTHFHDAIRAGNLEEVKRIYGESSHQLQLISGLSAKKTTALHVAASAGYPDIVKFLIESGGSDAIAIVDSAGRTPIITALDHSTVVPRTYVFELSEEQTAQKREYEQAEIDAVAEHECALNDLAAAEENLQNQEKESKKKQGFFHRGSTHKKKEATLLALQQAKDGVEKCRQNVEQAQQRVMTEQAKKTHFDMAIRLEKFRENKKACFDLLWDVASTSHYVTAKGVDIRVQCDARGMNALFYAVSEGYGEVFNRLLAQADPQIDNMLQQRAQDHGYMEATPRKNIALFIVERNRLQMMETLLQYPNNKLINGLLAGEDSNGRDIGAYLAESTSHALKELIVTHHAESLSTAQQLGA